MTQGKFYDVDLSPLYNSAVDGYFSQVSYCDKRAHTHTHTHAHALTHAHTHARTHAHTYTSARSAYDRLDDERDK